MIALGEQHRQQFAARVENLGDVAFRLQSFARRRRAGGDMSGADLDDAQLAASMRRKMLVPAQMRDVMAGFSRGGENGLAVFERDWTSVQQKGLAHDRRSEKCAEASSRPVSWRARASAASRLKAG